MGFGLGDKRTKHVEYATIRMAVVKHDRSRIGEMKKITGTLSPLEDKSLGTRAIELSWLMFRL